MILAVDAKAALFDGHRMIGNETDNGILAQFIFQGRIEKSRIFFGTAAKGLD